MNEEREKIVKALYSLINEQTNLIIEVNRLEQSIIFLTEKLEELE